MASGAGYGAMHIPRVGSAVLVEFLDGDPDRPIVTGRVFFSLRCVFEYRIRKEERRTATLYDGAAPAEIPGSYRIVHESG